MKYTELLEYNIDFTADAAWIDTDNNTVVNVNYDENSLERMANEEDPTWKSRGYSNASVWAYDNNFIEVLFDNKTSEVALRGKRNVIDSQINKILPSLESFSTLFIDSVVVRNGRADVMSTKTIALSKYRHID